MSAGVPPHPSGPAAEFLDVMTEQGFYWLPRAIPSHVMGKTVETYRSALMDPIRSTAVMSLKGATGGPRHVLPLSVDDSIVPELRQVITTDVETLVAG